MEVLLLSTCCDSKGERRVRWTDFDGCNRARDWQASNGLVVSQNCVRDARSAKGDMINKTRRTLIVQSRPVAGFNYRSFVERSLSIEVRKTKPGS